MFTDFGSDWGEAFAEGDREAWQHLLRSEVGLRIIRKCRASEAELKRLGYLRQATYEDILHECLIQILQAVKKYWPKGVPENPGGLLWTAAERAAVTFLSRSRGSAKGLYQAAPVTGAEGEKQPAIDVYAADLSALDEYGTVDLIDLIDRAGIEPVAKEIVMMRRDGYTFAEIAERLKMPESTVRAKLGTAAKKLRKAMGE